MVEFVITKENRSPANVNVRTKEKRVKVLQWYSCYILTSHMVQTLSQHIGTIYKVSCSSHTGQFSSFFT